MTTNAQILLEAIKQNKLVEFSYYSEKSDMKKNYKVQPLAVGMKNSANETADCFDVSANHVKSFVPYKMNDLKIIQESGVERKYNPQNFSTVY